MPISRLLPIAAAASTLVVVAASLAFAAPPTPAPQSRGAAGEFDYYLLALSWSPEYCAGKGAKSEPGQCAAEKRYGFVVHGLWPQYEKGGYPETCRRTEPVPAEMLEAIRPIMPGDELIQHQWRKHGSCSGLSLDYYFADLRIAWERMKIPDIFKEPSSGMSMPAIDAVHAIADANPDLPANSIAGVCEKGRLTEVRICLNKDLDPRTCGAKVTANCGKNDKLVVR